MTATLDEGPADATSAVATADASNVTPATPTFDLGAAASASGSGSGGGDGNAAAVLVGPGVLAASMVSCLAVGLAMIML